MTKQYLIAEALEWCYNCCKQF